MYKSIILMLILCSAATADVPTLMNYQGWLTDAIGTPLNGPYTIVFTIYNDPILSAPGNIIWQQTQLNVSVTGGLFNVLLGAGTPAVPVTESVFSSANRWLGITVATDPEITPRTQLVSVGYAFVAARAQSADYSITGGGWTDDGRFVRLTNDTDSVGIGTTTPRERLEIMGNLRLPPSTANVGVINSGGARFIHNFGTDNTFIGINAGNLTMTGSGNTASGDSALSSNIAGNDNTANGAAALTNNTSGNMNTASGFSALYSNVDGYNNTASGFSALRNNNTGYANTANGGSALRNNTTGYSNTASGADALYNNTTGNNNTANGTGALRYNTGSWNTASGFIALYLNTTGVRNTATGAGALQSNTTGYNNTASGLQALYNNTTGYCNTATGMSALFGNTTGFYNTACGFQALLMNTTGYCNTSSGFKALFSNDTGKYNTACGYAALYNNTADSNTASGAGALYNNTTGKYNTANGTDALYNNITGTCNTASGFSALYSNIGNDNTATGRSALGSNTSGNFNTGTGIMALYNNITGDENTAIGFRANVLTGDLINATAIGAWAIVDDSNKIRLGNDAIQELECQVSLTAVSDRNLKENFQPVNGDEVLRKIRGLSLTSWNYKGHDPQQFRHYGPVAQEFFAAFGHDGVGTCGDSTTINSGDMAGILMIAVQTLEKRTAEVETVKAENNNLRVELDELKRMVSQLMAQSEQSGSSQYGRK
jgi:hypothetical protein